MRMAFPTAWSNDLMESDRRYFEADAELAVVPGAVVARLRGLESLAAGCVVQRIDAARLPADIDAWLAALEQQVRGFGSPRARLYLDAPHEPLAAALARRGYRAGTEIGLLRHAGGGAGAKIQLLPADDARGWSERRRLMERSRRAPDGHNADPDLWVEMERRKCRAGYLQPYLIVEGDAVVGAMCLAPAGSILRLKNLIVDPDHRRRGIATAAAACLARLAAESGYAGAGCFVLENEPGAAAYTNTGFRAAITQTEWVRKFGDRP